MERRKVRDGEEARVCLVAVAESGMDRAAWARQHGLCGRSLNAWRLILERKARRAAPLRLVEWVPTASATVEAARYVVRCGSWSVEVDERFDGEVLRRLLAVVAAC